MIYKPLGIWGLFFELFNEENKELKRRFNLLYGICSFSFFYLII